MSFDKQSANLLIFAIFAAVLGFRNFIKDQSLIIAMAAGIGAYILYRWIPAIHPAGPFLHALALKAQPVLIFCMLFLQFSKIAPKDIRFEKWHLKLLAVQSGSCLACAAALFFVKAEIARVVIESLMLCSICPTAIAAGVVTDKIGGSISGIMSYLILVNCMVSLLVPAVFPLVHPIEGSSFFQSFLAILGKVFPMLILPALSAWALRYLWPAANSFFRARVGAAFYLWLVALSIALVITTHSIFNCNIPLWSLLLIAVVPVASCLLQFGLGHRIGNAYGKQQRITAGQALGQKNTSLMIWIGYMFLTPQTSIAGGIYSICHNLVNSREIARKNHSTI